jgi:hypothetical protein
MRKTLLIAAAALAAGVISSQAQVYSQNIVGYVNQPLPLGYVNVANPLDASGGNSITNVIPVFSGVYDGDIINIWTGHSYLQLTIDSGQPTGIGNASDTAPVVPPVLAPGQAIFIQNTAGPVTNTFVGTVHIDGAGASTNVVGLTTNAVPLGFTFLASVLPVGGGISSVLGLPKDGSLDGSIINIPIINGSGNIAGFTQITIDSGQPTGFGNASDTASVPEPTIPVGTGFLLQNTAGVGSWIQSY